jgi:hypothetical protein
MNAHYIFLPSAPWAGPMPSLLKEQDKLDLHQGEVVYTSVEEPLRYELSVETNAEDPHLFPPLDLHDAGKGHLLMSDKLVKCLLNSGITNIQFFDAIVNYVPTGEVLKYKVANIIGLVQALDTDASDCEIDEDGFVECFWSLVLKNDNTLSLDFFRMYESFHTIIISKKIKEAIESENITGIKILSESEWEPGML